MLSRTRSLIITTPWAQTLRHHLKTRRCLFLQSIARLSVMFHRTYEMFSQLVRVRAQINRMYSCTSMRRILWIEVKKRPVTGRARVELGYKIPSAQASLRWWWAAVLLARKGKSRCWLKACKGTCSSGASYSASTRTNLRSTWSRCWWATLSCQLRFRVAHWLSRKVHMCPSYQCQVIRLLTRLCPSKLSMEHPAQRD